MQTKKPSFRLIPWLALMAVGGSLATACVVSSDDDGDGDSSFGGSFGFGGDGGSSTNGGEAGASTGGTAGTGGTTGGTAGTGGTTGGTGGTAAGGEGGTGGTGTTYEGGLCDTEDAAVESSQFFTCAEDPESEDDCSECAKANCCELWQACTGYEPSNACAVSPTEGGSSEFACIQDCFADTYQAGDDADDVIYNCSLDCGSICGGFINTATSDLVGCVTIDHPECADSCFPLPE